MDTRRNRRTVGAFLGIVAVAVFAVTFSFGPLHASAQNINPCGTLWSDTSSDASAGAPTASQADQLDIVSGKLSDNGSALTTTLTIKNLTQIVPSPGTDNVYYLVWAFNSVSYFTSADYSSVMNTVTYAYGTATMTGGTTNYTTTATLTTGTFGSGPNALITVTVPFSDIGSPVAGDAFAQSGIFGESDVYENGVIILVGGAPTDNDPSSYDYVVGESCTGTTPTPIITPTPTTTTTASSSCAVGVPEQNISLNGFICPIKLPNSGGLGEPTLIHDSGAGNTTANIPRLFVQAPEALGNGTSGGSPMWTSLDGGLHWSNPPVQSPFCTVASGGDTDLATDSNDNVYSTDLWLGNSCVSVSTDHGASFAAGDPYGSHIQPGDDRPWIAYSKSLNENFFTYDGVDAVHIANTAPITTPPVGVQAINDNVVVTEVAVNSSSVPDSTRACVCPPGGIAIDNTTGAHSGRVYVTYSHQKGEAIAYSDPVAGTAATWTQVLIPDHAAGSAFQDEWNFSPVKVDGNGTVYVMWAHALNFASNLAGSGGVQEYYSFSKDGGATWHAPILLSTEAGTTTFPTMDIAGNGTLDTAWYGTTSTGDPNSVASGVGGATWNIYYARVTNADTGSPSFSPVVAIQDMHNGCIQSGGGKSCADRSLLDFFQITSDPGFPHIIFDDGDATTGVNVWFTKMLSTPGPATPEAPWAVFLLIPGAGAALLASRVRGRKRRAVMEE